MTTSDASPRRTLSRTSLIVGIVGLIIVVSAIVVAVPLVATSTPEFFGRYHLLERRYTNLEDSAHEGIGCRSCHETAPIENGIALVADFYVGLFTDSEKPIYFTFEPPRNEACLKCHATGWSDEVGRTSKIPHPAHLRVVDETRACVDCHKWTAHLEPYLVKHQTMPFSGVCVAYGCHVGTKTTEQCFDCHHVLHENGEQWRTEHPKTVAKIGENACLEQCHQVKQCQYCHTTGKRPTFTGQTIETSMKSIEELHVKPEWTAVHHGEEALKNRANCLRCHQGEGECQECHRNRPAFHGSTDTWIGRHPDQAKSVTDPRCIECHKRTWCEECHAQFKEME